MQKLLIVDDEQRTLDGVAQRVRNSGIDLEIAGLALDGIEALELTRLHRPGIVVCDIRMPGMDGIAYALKAREIDPDIAVIFMSGYSDREYLKTAIRIGAVDYLDKPVDDAQFNEALGRAIQRREEAESLPAQAAFGQETLRLLLTGNNEEIIRSIADISPDTESAYVVMVAMLHQRDAADDIEQQFNMFTLHMMAGFSNESGYRYSSVRIDNQIVLLIKDECGGAPLEQRVGELALAMLEEFPEAGRHISIGIGCPYVRLIDASRSYRAACQALELVFFRGIGSVIPHDGARGGCLEFDEGPLHEIDAYFGCDDLSQATEAVGNLHARIAENERTPAWRIKTLAWQIMQALMKNYEKSFLENMLENPAGLHNAAMTALTLEQLFGLIHQLIAKYSNAIVFKDKKTGAVYNAKRYIWNHLAEEISIKQVAAAVYLSPTYLCALFKEVTGVTINQYMQQARMDKARSLLANTRRTVGEIAELVGYRNIGYFNRVFNRHAGMAPAQYRRKQYDVQ